MREIPEDSIKRAQDGDIGAFEEIYRAASGYVYTIALRITDNREDAQEVAQDVFMNVYRKLRDFRFGASLKTWLYRITVNAAINLVKKNQGLRKRQSLMMNIPAWRMPLM